MSARNMILGIVSILLSFSAHAAELATKAFELGKFTRIDAGGSLEIDILVGEAQSVALVGDEKILKDLTVRVMDETLQIEKREGASWQLPWQNQEVKLIVKVPTLESLDLSGAAKGQVSKINGKEFEIAVSGAADISLSGKVDELSLDLSGSGKIRASDLEAKRVIADVAGAGDVEVFATQLLDADVSGVGNLSYKGKPAIVKTDVSGVGKVQPKS